MASSSSTECVPSWVELPPEITATILHKLGTVEILLTAQKVCTTWRRVCRDPAMWRRIHIPKRADLEMFLDWDGIIREVHLSLAHLTEDDSIEFLLYNCDRCFRMCIQNWVPWKRADLEKWQRISKRADLDMSLIMDRICRRAVDLSQGRLTDINIECDVSNDLLLYICRRVPWKRADLEKWQRFPKRDDLDISLDMDRICRRAVDLSQGHLTDINIECDVTNGLLLYISQRSSQLSRLQLRSLSGMTALEGDCLELAVKSLPLLEELHLYLSGPSTIYGSVVENVGLSCPLLKSFRLNGKLIEHNYDVYEEEALAIAESMPQLRHLQLVGNFEYL